MLRLIRREFNNGNLVPNTELIELKHIGTYLYDRMLREFGRRNQQRLTIRSFANKIRNMNIDLLKRKLSKSLQNLRNNQCVHDPGKPKYHVQDVNQKGYEVMIALIKCLDRGDDGFNLGANFVFDSSQLRATHRSESAKFVSCINSRRRCTNSGGIWTQGRCIPPSNARGFQGVHTYSGQKTYTPRDRRQRLGSERNSITRGQYTRSPNHPSQMWRRPGRMNKV